MVWATGQAAKSVPGSLNCGDGVRNKTTQKEEDPTIKKLKKCKAEDLIMGGSMGVCNPNLKVMLHKDLKFTEQRQTRRHF